MTDLASSQGLVLRKLDYSETSLIFHLLSRDMGRQDFLVKGARKTGKTKFPAVDLFRLVDVAYRHRTSSELQTARSVELVTSFDGIARVRNHFRTAVWLCRFVEQNTVLDDPTPQLFQALLCAFRRLDGPKTDCIPVWQGFVFSAFDEHGLLPDLSKDPDREEAMSYMLAYATDHELPPPEYNDDTWLALTEWIMDFCDAVQIRLPDGLEQIE